MILQFFSECLPIQLKKSSELILLNQSINDFSEYTPNRLMSEEWYSVFFSKYVENDLENDLNKIHFQYKLVETMISERFDKKVGDRIDKPVNYNVLHSFVKNWSIFEHLLVRRAIFMKEISKKGITNI